MADSKQGAGLSSGSSAAVHKASSTYGCAITLEQLQFFSKDSSLISSKYY